VGVSSGGDRRNPSWSSVVPDRLADVGTLWTPDGEHHVADRADDDADHGPDEPTDADEADVRARIDEARARVADVPAELIVTNHAMGLYELAAIHLSGSPPDLAAAALAIDGFGCLVEGLGDRLGPDVATLRDALAQIRLAFVQVKGSVEAGATPPSPPPSSGTDPAAPG
jgi:hypothetical protein